MRFPLGKDDKKTHKKTSQNVEKKLWKAFKEAKKCKRKLIKVNKKGKSSPKRVNRKVGEVRERRQ